MALCSKQKAASCKLQMVSRTSWGSARRTTTKHSLPQTFETLEGDQIVSVGAATDKLSASHREAKVVGKATVFALAVTAT